MAEQVQKPTRAQKSKDAPYPIYKLLPYADSIIDVVSTKVDKKERSNFILDELKDSRQKAKDEYEEKKKSLPEKELLSYRHKFDYLDTLLVHLTNLTNSFDTMQTLWHLKTTEIANYYESKIGAGGFATNFKRFAPWLFTPVVVVISAVTGAWGDVHQLIADAFAKWNWGMVNMAKFGSDVIGLVGLTLISTRINQRANDWVHSIRRERDKKLKHFIGQEEAVRKAIRATVQQIALGLSAEFGYTNELRRVGDNVLLGAKGNLEFIWKTVSGRLSEIKNTLPKQIQELFASSLDLPDYIASITTQVEKNVQPKPEEQKQ